MGHFSDKKTEIELFVIENFNYEDDNPYSNQIEEEGEFVQINPLENKEDENGDTVPTSSKLPTKQRRRVSSRPRDSISS